MPFNFPLDPVGNADALAVQLNKQEEQLTRQFLDVHGVSTGAPADQLNVVTIEFNVEAPKLKRLSVKPVPAQATKAAADATTTPEAAQGVKDEFKKFVAPLLDAAEVLDRSEVFLGNARTEVVVLRAAEPLALPPPTGTKLNAGPGWEWTAEVVGDDIVVRGAKTTAFGGADDKGDNGECACGFPTKGHPDLFGCALPLAGYAQTAGEHAALDGTPLPHMPFGLTSKGINQPTGAHVEVVDPVTGNKVTVPVIDLGPAKDTGHALDLTVAAARVFKSNATANNFSMKLDYRIIGGARFIPA